MEKHRKMVFILLTMVISVFNLSQNISSNTELITEEMIDNATLINENEVDIKVNSGNVNIKVDGKIALDENFTLYKSPYDEIIVFESVGDNEEVISVQLLPTSKNNRLLTTKKILETKILQMVFRKGDDIFLYEGPLKHSVLYDIENIELKDLPKEKIQVLDWWLLYIKPRTSLLNLNSYSNYQHEDTRMNYNNRVERKRLSVRYDRFDTEYEMDVVAELRTYNIGYYGDGEQRISLFVDGQRQYENGRYRDNNSVLLIKDPIFKYELVDHSGVRNEDGFYEVSWYCPSSIVRRPRFRFGGFSSRPWDWIEIDSQVIGGSDNRLLRYGTKEFGSQVIGATDGTEIEVSARLKKNTRGDYRHKLYVDIEFDFCYYNYNTVVGSERMYVAGYIDSND